MELSLTLGSLHRHLGLLVNLLEQEQEALLHPSPETDDLQHLHHLDQEKHKQFQAIEELEGECDELKESLGAGAQAPALTYDLPLWHEVLELSGQAARLHQLNSTLIRHGLVHQQCLLNNLRRLGTPATHEHDASSASNQTAARKPARKTRGRSKKTTEHVGQHH
jgi:flagellar biosynthesis/type III secretory pathway chaperone